MIDITSGPLIGGGGYYLGPFVYSWLLSIVTVVCRSAPSWPLYSADLQKIVATIWGRGRFDIAPINDGRVGLAERCLHRQLG
jgi:hypothetical protein